MDEIDRIEKPVLYRIYKIVCSSSAKLYVGFTKRSLSVRFRGHCLLAKRGSKYKLHCAIRKYGAESFSIHQIETAESFEEALLKEMNMISILKTNSRFGYNMTSGGDGVKGLRHTPAVREKISEKVRTAWKKPAYRKKMSSVRKAAYERYNLRAVIVAANTGKRNTPEQREHHSKTAKAQWRDPVVRAKMVAAQRARREREARLGRD